MKIKKILQGSLISCALFTSVPAVHASANPFIGEIDWFAGNFEPRGWAFCDGRLLPIAQNTALFSLLGTIYGGDGRTTFALPDVRGRVMVHAGRGPGLTDRRLGVKGGVENVTLNATQMPNHTHTLRANGGSATTADPTDNVLASTGRTRLYADSANANMDSSAVSSTGGSTSHTNVQPFTTLNCIIALQGVYPSRN